MARFGRKETFISSHYTHGFPQSPVAFHHIQPLTWGPYMAYGNPDFGYSYTIDYVRGRKTPTELRQLGANTAVYAAYDNVADLDAWVTRTSGGGYKKGMPNLNLIATWSDMTTVAASNSGAQLKTGYLLKLAGLILEDSNLVALGNSQAEKGVKMGEAPGSGSQTSDISNTYKGAISTLQGASKYKSGGSSNAQIKDILTALQKGTDTGTVDTRVKQYRKDQDIAKKNIPVDEGGTKEEACKDTFLGKIPGYCEAQFAFKVMGIVFVSGVALWGATKIVKQVKKARTEIAAPASNPRRNGRGRRLLGNPSAPGEMGTEPERQIARMTKGRLQEKRLAQNVFRMENE